LLEDEYIVGVGKRGDLEIPEDADVIDASGKTVIPGLIDAHVHFLWMGIMMKSTVDLSQTKSIEEAVDKLKKRVKETKVGDWVLGSGWDDSKWEDRRYINKWDLDPFSQDNPIVLTRVCGHLITLNSKALEIAGVSKDTPDPPGGEIDKSPDGDPTGILKDAMQLVQQYMPLKDERLAIEGLEVANAYALSLGCTGVHDAGLDGFGIGAFQKALKKGILKVRANVMWRGNLGEFMATLGLRSGFGSEMLRLGSAKLMIDGSLGARTAALYEPYEDDSSTKGLTMMTPEELTGAVKFIHDQGSQVAVHAIGDYAIDLVINSIEAALKDNPRKDHRHRIEHCELLSSDQIERIHQLGIVPSMQPNFAGEWSGPDGLYEARLGKRRLRQNNPYKMLLEEDVRIPFGSDGMPFNPMYGIHSAVNHPIRGSRITLIEAVKGFTLDAAYASFEEEIKGSIEPGKLADIVILGKDLTEVPQEEIKDVPVEMTMIGGEILYSKDQAD